MLLDGALRFTRVNKAPVDVPLQRSGDPFGRQVDTGACLVSAPILVTQHFSRTEWVTFSYAAIGEPTCASVEQLEQQVPRSRPCGERLAPVMASRNPGRPTSSSTRSRSSPDDDLYERLKISQGIRPVVDTSARRRCPAVLCAYINREDSVAVKPRLTLLEQLEQKCLAGPTPAEDHLPVRCVKERELLDVNEQVAVVTLILAAKRQPGVSPQCRFDRRAVHRRLLA